MSSQALYHPHEQFADLGTHTLCYETLGKGDKTPILLIMGLACQMTAWPPEFLEPLLASGHPIIRFDNREMGHSSELEAGKTTMPVPLAYARYKLGLPVESSYQLTDMAKDTAALLDHLNVARVHVVGVSMGGMVAQILAARYSDRVQSLSLMMTSDNSPKAPLPSVNTLWQMSGGGIKGDDREAALKRGLAFWRTVASPHYHTPEERIIQRITRDYQRAYRPAAVVRQMRAVLASGSLEADSRKVQAPTLILHGRNDPLVKPQAARRLARWIPHARIQMVQGWGHDMPLALCPRLADWVLTHAQLHESAE